MPVERRKHLSPSERTKARPLSGCGSSDQTTPGLRAMTGLSMATSVLWSFEELPDPLAAHSEAPGDLREALGFLRFPDRFLES
jgi:hypothetical protein